MIPIDLKGRKALITGGESGLGAATANSLAQAGADVAITYHATPGGRRKQSRQVQKSLAGKRMSSGSPMWRASRMSPSCSNGWTANIGGVDILVNNAGIDGARALCAESDPAAWRRVIDVDLVGAYNCAREAVTRMAKQERGVIINTTSVHEFIPWTGYSAYTSAKAGLSMFSKTLAQEVAVQGIRVIAIAPGAIKTPINAGVWQDPKGLADLDAKIPMGRIGEPDEVGHTIAFLCSDLAGYITGITVAIDGGMLLYPDFRHGG